MLIPEKVETQVLRHRQFRRLRFSLQQKVQEVLIDGLSIIFWVILKECLFQINLVKLTFYGYKLKRFLIQKQLIKLISFLQQKDFKYLKECIEPNQLEEKFGGNQVNFTKFWPSYHLDLPDGYTKKDNKPNKKQNFKILNIKIEKEEDKYPYDQVEFQLKRFYKIVITNVLWVSNIIQLQINEEDKIEKKQNESPNKFIQERGPQTNPQQQNNLQIILDEPEQPDLQQQIIHQEQEKNKMFTKIKKLKKILNKLF